MFLTRYAALLLASCGLLGSASAAIMITPGPGGGNPDENVLFNKPGLVLSGDPVQGATNQTLRVLDIQSNQGISLLANGGQARIERLGGGGFNGVMFIPHSGALPGGLLPLAGFSDFKFNLDATQNGTVDIVVDGLNSSNVAIQNSLLGTFLDGNGQNFFRIIAGGGDVITKITVTANGDFINKVEQIRLGGLTAPGGVVVNPPPTPDPPPPGPVQSPTVPEPTSLAVWAVVAAAGAALRMRHKG